MQTQHLNIRAFNCTGPAQEVAKPSKQPKLDLAWPSCPPPPRPEPVEAPPTPTRRGRKVRRKASSAPIAPGQITLAKANGNAGLTWVVIAGHLKVSESGLENVVSKATRGPLART